MSTITQSEELPIQVLEQQVDEKLESLDDDQNGERDKYPSVHDGNMADFHGARARENPYEFVS
jgi:hypothetical protein